MNEQSSGGIIYYSSMSTTVAPFLFISHTYSINPLDYNFPGGPVPYFPAAVSTYGMMLFRELDGNLAL